MKLFAVSILPAREDEEQHEELFQYPLSLDVDAQLGNVTK